MVAPVQQFSFRESHYLRPTQKWVCGRLGARGPCRIGPDKRGNCRATYECKPQFDESRWRCTRSEFAGGFCKEGPLPDGTCCREIVKCRPVWSWRAKRSAATKWVFSITIGLVLVLTAAGGGKFFVDPGRLTSQHAELSSCEICHRAFEGGASGWRRVDGGGGQSTVPEMPPTRRGRFEPAQRFAQGAGVPHRDGGIGLQPIRFVFRARRPCFLRTPERGNVPADVEKVR